MEIKEKILNNLSPETGKILLFCSETAQEKGFKIYLVGGPVRDLLTNKKIFDVDITVEGDAVKFCRILEKKNLGRIKAIQKDLKTVKMIFPDNIEIDFASTRTESYPKKGCMPVILETGVSLDKDVKRRDFTLNALAASLNKEDFGTVKDYVNGLDDLGKKQLRILHDDSFTDDPTRIIRGLKFSVRFDFSLEENTRKQQEEYLNSYISTDICLSRIKSELIQTFNLNIPRACDLFVSQRIYKLINPDFSFDIDSLKASELIRKYMPENVWMVYLAPFFFNSSYKDLFEFTRTEKKILNDLKKMVAASCPKDNFAIYKFFENSSLESVLAYFLITKNHSVIEYLDNFSKIKLEITGSDLIEAGLAPSGEFAKILDIVLEEKLSGNLLNKEDELNFLKFKIKQLKK